jgi:hypothetical protein
MAETAIVHTDGGEEPAAEHTHELGEHDAQINELQAFREDTNKWRQEAQEKLDGVGRDVGDLLMKAGTVPEEVWNRLGAVEQAIASIPEAVANAIKATAETPLDKPPEDVQVPKTEPEPKATSKNPIRSLLHAFR